MSDKKKSKTTSQPTGKPKASAASGVRNEVVDEWGNRWQQGLPLSEEELSEVELQLRITTPPDLRKLFLTCNGGRPEKTYFANQQIEVEIGSLLPIRPPASRKGPSFESTCERMDKAGLFPKLLPFALDNGNAGVFCVDATSGEVAYWVHNYPEEPLRTIAAALTDFLSRLDFPPY